MAFWNIGGFHTVSAVERILEKENHTLRDVLGADDLISEVLAPNTKLIDYLRKPEIILELAQIVVNGPPKKEAESPQPSELAKSPDNSESDSDRTDDENSDSEDDDPDATQDEIDLPRLATEILSVDVWCLMDSLLQNTEAMDLLWSILDEPLADNLSGRALNTEKVRLTNFTKIMENVLEKRTEQTLAYIKGVDKLASCFLNHVDNPPLVDLLLKIIATDVPDQPTGIIDLLYQQNLIPRMVRKLGPDTPHSEQMAVGDFLKAFVTISGGNKAENCSIGPNELSRQLVSTECLEELIDLMLKGGSGLGIAVGVIIEIIRKNNSDFDFVQVLHTTLESHPPSLRDSIYLGTMVRLFAKAIPKFQEMLTREHTETMEMPFGTIKPLGFERFRICELYAELLHCSNMTLLNKGKGESVVRERDDERRRVYYSDNNERKGGESPAVRDSPPPLGQEEVADVEVDEDVSSPKSEPNLEQQEELTGEALAAELKKQEADIRKSPVIGDQLKLALDDNGCISTVFSMLFEFPWNNFLHNVVFDVVQQIFNGSLSEGYNKFLAIHLFTRDHITERIVQGQNSSDEYERTKHTHLGYAGHLTLISEEVVKFAAVFPPQTVSPEVATALESHDWTYYVGHTLLKLREQYNTILGGRKPEDDEEDEEDGNNMMISLSETGERIDEAERLSHLDLDDGNNQFSRYMSHQLGNSATHFGSSDEDDDDEWESMDRQDRNLGYRDLGSDDDDEDDDDIDDESANLKIKRIPSYTAE